MSNKIFKGFKQVSYKDFVKAQEANELAGYMWFVRTEVLAEGEDTNDRSNDEYDIYFGSRKYSHFCATELPAIMAKIESLNGDITDILEVLDGLTGAVEANTNAISELQTSVDTKANAKDVSDGFDAVNAELAKKVDTEVYEKKVESLEEAIKKLPNFDIVVVEELPTEAINDKAIYLVKDKDEAKDLYTEYIYVNGVWENLGKQEIDLTDYLKGVTVNGIVATVENNVANVNVDGAHIKLGAALTVDGNPDNGLEGDESNVRFDEETQLSTVLQGIYLQIKQAEAGGVNSVTAGDTSITVNAADHNNPTVRVNAEVADENTIADGHIELVAGINGLYGVMYYDGDDAE